MNSWTAAEIQEMQRLLDLCTWHVSAPGSFILCLLNAIVWRYSLTASSLSPPVRPRRSTRRRACQWSTCTQTERRGSWRGRPQFPSMTPPQLKPPSTGLMVSCLSSSLWCAHYSTLNVWLQTVQHCICSVFSNIWVKISFSAYGGILKLFSFIHMLYMTQTFKVITAALLLKWHNYKCFSHIFIFLVLR